MIGKPRHFVAKHGANGRAAAKSVMQYMIDKVIEYYQNGKAEKSIELFGQLAGVAGLQAGRMDEKSMQQIQAMMLGDMPDGSTLRQPNKDRRMSTDITISAPKSVSVMSIGDDRLLTLHDEAVRETLTWFEQTCITARYGKGGAEQHLTGKMVAMLATHIDARPVDGRVDKQIHTHCNIINATHDGKKWRALNIDFGHHNEKRMLMDVIYKSILAKKLQAIGYEIRKTKDGFEIAGLTQEQLDTFSNRTVKQINVELARMGLTRETSSDRIRDKVNLKTRESKTRNKQTQQEMEFEHRARARAAGIDFRALKAEATEHVQRSRDTAQEREAITAADLVQSAARHLGERDTIFSRSRLEKEALSGGFGIVDHAEIAGAIDRGAGGLIDAGKGEGLAERNLTTKAALLREKDILLRVKDGQDKCESIVKQENANVYYQHQPSSESQELDAGYAESGPTNDLPVLSQCRLAPNNQRESADILQSDARSGGRESDSMRRQPSEAGKIVGLNTGADNGTSSLTDKIIADHEKRMGALINKPDFAFGQGQRKAIELALTSKDQFMGIVGYAGAGKTTAMSVIASEYQEAGYEVIGVAPTAKAKRELESAGCDQTKTLASVLVSKTEQEDKPHQKLYILDEAGMVSAEDMDNLIKRAIAENARILFVGDPLQLEAVMAGQPYAQLLESGVIKFATIDEIQRQKDLRLREMALAFASGNAKHGVELAEPYIQEVVIKKGEGKELALAAAAAKAYLALSPQERTETIVLAATNKTRKAINIGVRTELQERGEIGKEEVILPILEKLDLKSKEAATRAETYTPEPKKGEEEPETVIIEFTQQHADRNGENAAEKRSQWQVIARDKQILTLQNLHHPEKIIQVNPARVKIDAFTLQDLAFSVGDEIVFRQNDAERKLENGMNGKVVAINLKNKSVSIRDSLGRDVTLSLNRAETIDYSYARTVHSSQGATFNLVIAVGEAVREAMANLAYVATTRERNALLIITDNISRLKVAWGKYAKKQFALNLAKYASPDERSELTKARHEAGQELGQAGDLERKREQPIHEEPKQAVNPDRMRPLPEWEHTR